MKNTEGNALINSYFKNGELYIQIENDDLDIDDLPSEQLALAVKEGVRSVLNQLFQK